MGDTLAKTNNKEAVVTANPNQSTALKFDLCGHSLVLALQFPAALEAQAAAEAAADSG